MSAFRALRSWPLPGEPDFDRLTQLMDNVLQGSVSLIQAAEVLRTMGLSHHRYGPLSETHPHAGAWLQQVMATYIRFSVHSQSKQQLRYFPDMLPTDTVDYLKFRVDQPAHLQYRVKRYVEVPDRYQL
jgi:hypothetical protein